MIVMITGFGFICVLVAGALSQRINRSIISIAFLVVGAFCQAAGIGIASELMRGRPITDSHLLSYGDQIYTVVWQDKIGKDRVAIIKSAGAKLFFIIPGSELPQEFAVISIHGYTSILPSKNGKVEIDAPSSINRNRRLKQPSKK